MIAKGKRWSWQGAAVRVKCRSCMTACWSLPARHHASLGTCCLFVQHSKISQPSWLVIGVSNTTPFENSSTIVNVWSLSSSREISVLHTLCFASQLSRPILSCPYQNTDHNCKWTPQITILTIIITHPPRQAHNTSEKIDRWQEGELILNENDVLCHNHNYQRSWLGSENPTPKSSSSLTRPLRQAQNSSESNKGL